MFRKLIGEPIEISSSDIRGAVKAGRDISTMVPPAVADYIRANRLYL